MFNSGNTKGGSITVPLTSCFTGLDESVLQKNVSCHTANSKAVKKEVNDTVLLPPLVFPVQFIVIALSKLKALHSKPRAFDSYSLAGIFKVGFKEATSNIHYSKKA